MVKQQQNCNIQQQASVRDAKLMEINTEVTAFISTFGDTIVVTNQHSVYQSNEHRIFLVKKFKKKKEKRTSTNDNLESGDAQCRNRGTRLQMTKLDFHMLQQGAT